MNPPLTAVASSVAAARPTEAANAPYQPFAGHAPDVIRDALSRIVGSRTFRRSTRHKQFLHHVVGAALDGRYVDLKEVVIGLQVFDRDLSHYDPRKDPVVRVEAGRVREKLARYYAGEGAADAFELQIPVGGYLPQLSRRQASRPAARNLGSIAVLPFASLSTLPADAIFCEALADQLIDMLSRVPGLRVVGRMSTFKAQAHSADPKAIGTLLGATSVLQGSVQRAGTRYRCIAQLFRSRDRACTWSQRFEFDVVEDADLFALQDRIGEAVLAAVVPRPPASETTTEPAHRAGTADVAARDLFERGRYLEQQRSIEGWQKAIPLFERAVALDPDFAAAHSHLGACKGYLAGMLSVPMVPAFREVERCCRRALELDPHDGDARGTLASIAFRIEFDWARAEPMFRDALRAAPNSTTVHRGYAAGLVFNGRYVEAIEHGRIALDLDPLNLALRADFALICAYARDFATAIAEFEAVLDFDRDHLFAHVMIGMTHLWAQDADRAEPHFEHAIACVPSHPAAHFCRIFVRGFRGEIEAGRRELHALVERLGNADYARYNRAMAEAYLGDRDAMYATLAQVAARREILFVSLPADPSFDRYRDDPEWLALMSRHGLHRAPPSPFSG